MNRPTIAATVLAALALAGCATSSRNTGSPASYTPPASASAAAPVGSNMPSASAKASCKLGWYRLDSSGYSSGPFHPGYAPAASQTQQSAYQATMPSGVTADWISVTFYLDNGKKAGAQTTTANVPQTGGTWSALLTPDEALGNDPGIGNQAPHGTTCTVTAWGNAAGS